MSDFIPPDGIQWHEGMLLTPQHFQQMGLRQEALLHYHVGAIQPFHWGVRQLSVDPSLLVDGTFRINELVAVMPDALLVVHPNGEGDLELDLQPYMDEIMQRPMPVHIVVPALKSDTPNKGDLARYESAEGPPTADFNTGETSVRIPRLRPRVGLLLGEKPSDKYVSFPIAEVAYRNEALVLTDFVPPCLWVPTGSVLGRRAAMLAKTLREKAVFLSERLMGPSARAGDPMVSETQGLIRGLVAGLPWFEATLNTGLSHPHQVYLALCNLIGNLAAVGGGFVPPALPPYNHNDLRGTFNRALDFALRMIESVREAYVAIPFERKDGSFELMLDKAWVKGKLIIGARGRPGVSDSEVAAWMEDALMGSEPMVPSMEERRVLGPERRRLEREDSLGLVPVRGVALIELEADPAYVLADEVLQVINRGDPRGERAPADLVLYISN
ncbi:MAG: type VI secretion system baseplate subunit TssK, partial [Rhodospirillales bacterium]